MFAWKTLENATCTAGYETDWSKCEAHFDPFFYSSIEVKLTMDILSWVLEIKSLFLTSEAVAESLVYERLRKHKYKHKPLLV